MSMFSRLVSQVFLTKIVGTTPLAISDAGHFE